MTRPKCGWIASRTLAWHPTPWSATPHSVICTRKDLLTNIRVMRSALLTIVGICRIQSHDSDIYTWHGFVQTIAGCVSGRDIGLGLVRALQHHFGVINANVVWPKQNAFHARIQRCNCSRAFFVDIAPARATPSIDLTHTIQQYRMLFASMSSRYIMIQWYIHHYLPCHSRKNRFPPRLNTFTKTSSKPGPVDSWSRSSAYPNYCMMRHMRAETSLVFKKWLGM